MKRAALATVLALAMILPSHAQDSLETNLAACRQVDDSLQRLVCYDEIQTTAELIDDIIENAPIAKGFYLEVDLDEFKVDKDTLVGKRVQVSGTITQFGEMILLTSGDMDMNPVFVDLKQTPRQQKLDITRRCKTTCRANVIGEVSEVFFQTGINAASIELL